MNAQSEIPYLLRGVAPVGTDSSLLVSSSRYLNHARLREWLAMICLRRNGPDFPPQAEMYEFVYEGQKVRLECGGGGDPSRTSTTRKDKTQECIVHVSGIEIPPGLVNKGDNLLTLIVKAFEAHWRPYISGDLVVEFKM